MWNEKIVDAVGRIGNDLVIKAHSINEKFTNIRPNKVYVIFCTLIVSVLFLLTIIILFVL